MGTLKIKTWWEKECHNIFLICFFGQKRSRSREAVWYTSLSGCSGSAWFSSQLCCFLLFFTNGAWLSSHGKLWSALRLIKWETLFWMWLLSDSTLHVWVRPSEQDRRPQFLFSSTCAENAGKAPNPKCNKLQEGIQNIPATSDFFQSHSLPFWMNASI